MTSFRPAAIAIVAVAFIACGGDVVTGGSGGSTSTGTGSGITTHSVTTTSTSVPPPYDTCSAVADCAWGEIDHEILTPADCPCLYGCPYLPLSKVTVDRRESQYKMLCTPGQDGQGNGCGIDDCAVPSGLTCIEGQCAVAPPPP